MKNNKISYINNTLSKNYFFSFSIAAIIILLSIIITYRTKIFILLRFFIEFMETFFQTLITYATMMTSIEKDIPNINTTQDTMQIYIIFRIFIIFIILIIIFHFFKGYYIIFIFYMKIISLRFFQANKFFASLILFILSNLYSSILLSLS